MNIDVVKCPVCSRATSAARGSCIYCGAEIGASRIEVAPSQRPIDSFQNAFNTVLDALEPGQAADQAAAQLASALTLDLDESRSLVTCRKRIPIARSQTRHEAELIAQLVRTCGLSSTVIEDAELRLAKDLNRARRILVEDARFVIAHPGGILLVPLADVKVMVVGLLKSKRTDFTEAASSLTRQGASPIDTYEFRSDQMLLDVYTRDLSDSFRIRSDAFDYSSLVSPLSFRAEENFQALAGALAGAAPGMKIDTDFARLRPLLTRAWPERTIHQSGGIKRAGLVHQPVAQSSIIVDNRDQFDRYSRLVYHAVAR